MRGRLPSPTRLPAAVGEITQAQLRVPCEAPDPPEPVREDAAALACWERLVPELMRAGLMARIYEGTLAVYCCSYATFIKGHRQLRALARKLEIDEEINPLGPMLQKTPNGFVVKSSVLIIIDKAAEQMRTYGAALGLSAVDLTRATMLDTQLDLFGEAEPADRFGRYLEAAE